MKIFCVNIAIFITLFVINSANLFAQNNAPQKLSLQNCITKAIANNLQIKQNKLQIETNENNLLLSSYSRYPSVNGTLNQSFQSGRSIDPFTNQYTDDKVSYQNLGLNMNMLLFGGKQVKNAILMNELGISSAQKDLKSVEENLTLAVIGAFFQVLNSEDQLEIVLKQAENSKYQLNRAMTLQ